VIVFPKFIGGRSAAGGPVNVDGVSLPRTEIELGVVCPPGVTPTTAVCFEHQTIKVRGDWVCPGSQAFDSKGICEDTSFEVFISIDGKAAFPADGGTYFSNQPHVQAPQCKNGYLIMWVVDNADRPIKFDGLIGDAVLRGPNNAAPSTSVVAGSSTAVSGYSAIPIQASVLNATNDVLDAEPTSLFPGGTELIFDGALGHYQRVTGVLYGDVKFDNEAIHGGPPTPANAFSDTFLILLTLDVNSNASNAATFVPLTFYNESAQPPSTTNNNFENPTDTRVEFLCWGQFKLSDIDNNLTQAAQGTRKGLFIAGPATLTGSPFVNPNDDPPGTEVTLLGLVHTVEGTAPNGFQERSYIFSLYNDSVGVDTEFEFVAVVD
jgi:hypothetical protein